MNLATPNQFIVAMQTRIPRAQVLLDRNLERCTTAIAVEVPSLSRTATVSDFSSQGSVDPEERLAIAAEALAREIQQEAINGYGLQPVIDAAREEGMRAVREHLAWLASEIEAIGAEVDDLMAADTDGSSLPSLIARKHAYLVAQARLSSAAT